MLGRFDLEDIPVAYFAEGPNTAVYEVLARREVHHMSLAHVAQRALLAGQVTRPLRLLDLRPHANGWPFLQSLRFQTTQRVAAQAARLGFEGIVYRSAQQFGADCYAIFTEAAIRSIRRLSMEPLVAADGGIHRAVAAALLGAQLSLVP